MKNFLYIDHNETLYNKATMSLLASLQIRSFCSCIQLVIILVALFVVTSFIISAKILELQ